MGNLHRRRKKERNVARRMAGEGWEAAERSDLQRAEEILRHAVKAREGDCALWNDLGLILWRRKKLREAEKAFRNALLVHPLYEDAKMNLASLLASRGFYRQAARLEEEMAQSAPHAEYHRGKAEEYHAAALRAARPEEREGPGG